MLFSKPFYKALEKCSEDGGNLASMHSAVENNLLQGWTKIPEFYNALSQCKKVHFRFRGETCKPASCHVGWTPFPSERLQLSMERRHTVKVYELVPGIS